MFSLGSDFSSRRLCEERNCTVMSTVSGCDVTYCATTIHGFNKHKTNFLSSQRKRDCNCNFFFQLMPEEGKREVERELVGENR